MTKHEMSEELLGEKVYSEREMGLLVSGLRREDEIKGRN